MALSIVNTLDKQGTGPLAYSIEHMVGLLSYAMLSMLSFQAGGVKRNKRLKVLINPAAGAGHAKALWIKKVEPIFRSADCQLDVTCSASQTLLLQLRKLTCSHSHEADRSCQRDRS